MALGLFAACRPKFAPEDPALHLPVEPKPARATKDLVPEATLEMPASQTPRVQRPPDSAQVWIPESAVIRGLRTK
ncbi:MAG: hypothetical protein AAF721_09570 [Myxococcota bacterium]